MEGDGGGSTPEELPEGGEEVDVEGVDPPIEVEENEKNDREDHNHSLSLSSLLFFTKKNLFLAFYTNASAPLRLLPPFPASADEDE